MDDAAARILAIAGTLIVVALIAAFTWHAISRPRLRLVYDDEARRWSTTPRDLLQYAVSIPFLIMLWELLFLSLLVLLPDYDAEKLLFVPTGFVIAIRVLAHIWKEPALEFAKMVPIVVVTSALLMVQIPTWDDLTQLGERYDVLANDVNSTRILLFALGVEFAAAALWFFIGVRGRAPRGGNVPGIPWRDYPDADWMRRGAHRSPFVTSPDAPTMTQSSAPANPDG